MINYNSQAGQDQFVLKVLNNKRNGYFLEIGSNHPINMNNSFILESKYDWKGIMVEYDNNWLTLYKQYRPNSIHVINDATSINYLQLLESNNFPSNLDYLQIDLEVDNGSTLKTLEILNNTVFNKFKFATITFEHDIYRGDFFNTRSKSRDIFESRGYIRVFSDVMDTNNAFEDWYVHPDLVDMNYVNKIKNSTSMEWKTIIYSIL